MSATRELLMAMYEAMRERFGPQHWWPASALLLPRERKLEICVGAILTQNTNWQNVEKALARLIEAGRMSVPALHAIDQADLAELIRPAGYFNVKAKRLGNFIGHVAERHDGDIDALLDRPAGELREDLLGISGIGPETADSMILYAAGKCTFVVDAYTRRVFSRHGLIGEDFDYQAVKDFCESHVPARVGLYNDYHAQLVAVGKTYCRPTARCAGCPLDRFPRRGGAQPSRCPSRPTAAAPAAAGCRRDVGPAGSLGAQA
jgi:endonuclease-3 related protein